jgi:hypothetical protein
MTALSIAVFSFITHSLAQAESAQSDLFLSINSVVSLTITNCDASSADTINIDIDPTFDGAFQAA